MQNLRTWLRVRHSYFQSDTKNFPIRSAVFLKKCYMSILAFHKYYIIDYSISLTGKITWTVTSVLARMCPIQSGINTRTFHSIQFWIDIRIDLWMCNIVNANSLSWMGIHRVGENNPIQFTFTNWLPSFQIKSWMGMRVCANGIRIGHNSE